MKEFAQVYLLLDLTSVPIYLFRHNEVQVLMFCVSFALLEVFISGSLCMKKNINGVRNLFGAAPQNQEANVEVWEKGGGGKESCEDDQNEKHLVR